MSRFDDIGQPVEPVKQPEGWDELDLDPSEVLLRRTPRVFVPTGWRPLDSRLRGLGIPLGSFCALVGPPGGGKTYLAIQLTLGLAYTVPTVGLYADWGRDPTASVMAVMEGASRQDVDERPKTVAPYLKEKLGKRLVFLRDSLNENGTIAGVFDLADTLGQCAVFLDSATACIPGDIPGIDESKTGSLEYNRLLSKYIRKRCMTSSHICIMTCEANRSFFRSKNNSENSNAIAAPSGGGIEYAADLVLALSHPDPETPNRHVELAKNRMFNWQSGLKDTFEASYSPYSTLEEITPDEAAANTVVAIENSNRPVKLAIRKYLAANPGSTQHSVQLGVRADNPTLGRDKIITVLKSMTKFGGPVIESNGNRNSKVYTLAYEPQATTELPDQET